ncbi:hypothetical protein F1880_007741 [Penicillium rolfsii]|nr:hypothetical protein F1880_007741 [Penicillium rolfsii]
MEKYRLPSDEVPSSLYRIHYPGSRTNNSPREDFVATHTSKIYDEDDDDEFKRDLEKQFTWSCDDPIPFISLFSDREHAENWGLKQPWIGKRPRLSHDNWALYVIDTTQLEDAYFFKLSYLTENLGLELPNKARQHTMGTYLCLYNVPAAAVAEKIEPREVENSRNERRIRKREEANKWDYLEGYDSSEREAYQENYNTIIEKNLDGDW